MSFLIALLAHSYFIYKDINYDHLMVGTGDQTYQMVLFKDYLYKQFTAGNFFYNFTFNGGGNFFTNLSYYYSTSLIYHLTVLITYFLETMGILSDVGVSYWANSILVISIFRSSIVLLITTKLIESFKVKRIIALFGATFYAVSVIYFRHVIFWEFFVDAMVWLPILILGSEKIIKNESGLVFSLGVCLALFNNAYFAYQSFLFLLGYIGLRLIVRLDSGELPVFEQIQRYFIYGVLGILLALPGFIPFVLGYFNTSRLSPDFNIPWSNFQAGHMTNLLFIDNTFMIPIIFIFLALTFYLYKSKKFTLFSGISIVLIILRYNPKLASLTNGLSYPQYRWMYILYIFIALAVGVGIQYIYDNLSVQKLKKNLVISALLTVVLYLTVYFSSQLQIEYSFIKWILITGVIQAVVLSIYVYWDKFNLKNFIMISIFLSFITIFVSNRQLYYDYGLRKEDYFVERFDNKDNKYHQAVNFIEEDADDFYRIDYFGGSNYSLPYEISTFNLYSSFQNQHQQYFERDFQILSDRDSNGEYSGLGKRKLLNSLFQVNYVIASENQTFRVPVGYQKVAGFEDLIIYKNDQPLEFIHPVSEIYTEEDFSAETFKDELILNGVITDDINYNRIMSNNQTFISELTYDIDYQNIHHEDDSIQTAEDNQLIINVDLEGGTEESSRVMLEYTLEPINGQAEGEYFINDYKIELNGSGLPYSEQRYRNRVPLDGTSEIVFNFEENTDYHFKIHNLHYIDETLLQNRIDEEDNIRYDYEIGEDYVKISYDNETDYPLMVLPIFNEPGWGLKVNGEQTDLLDVNSGMIGFKIPAGQVDIELQFKQPFLTESVILAALALFVLILLEKHRKQRIERQNLN
ncbi:MAG: YfhO family protein [Atopococcus tabaci]|uniref:YfhO family protein n=1 Tax=Atopococcus tabaci TaxID=269774 RepID=A0AA43UD04_9LACT|nr:YfhO family protein [Atopococcus tabaci]